MPRECTIVWWAGFGRTYRAMTGSGIELFVSGDQLLKGAALNAVQIAELLVYWRPGRTRSCYTSNFRAEPGGRYPPTRRRLPIAGDDPRD